MCDHNLREIVSLFSSSFQTFCVVIPTGQRGKLDVVEKFNPKEK